MGVFLTILIAGAECAGREALAVDHHIIFQRCPARGHTAQENRPLRAAFRCIGCGHTAHADMVGAVMFYELGWPSRSLGRHSEKPPRSRGGEATAALWDRAPAFRPEPGIPLSSRSCTYSRSRSPSASFARFGRRTATSAPHWAIKVR
ncbi:zinc ribbon domain-containing protein [Kitasatospora sp. NPDC085879]|uniref:zinc ribbon domain-containing protein n=1 Tax=Kitasatospora sp. NPDC085879 TaxID=3154769 RepID=UPI00343F7C4F